MADKQQALKDQIEDKLDQALKDSFPASDPVSNPFLTRFVGPTSQGEWHGPDQPRRG